MPLVRYAAPNANFVLVVRPHNGLGARSAPSRHCANQAEAVPDIKGRALDWLATLDWQILAECLEGESGVHQPLLAVGLIRRELQLRTEPADSSPRAWPIH